MSKTREKIIETAFLLFLKRGYRAVTLMDVVEAVGMTKGTFYYHFTNKKELLRETETGCILIMSRANRMCGKGRQALRADFASSAAS